jgi:hypothetical protein
MRTLVRACFAVLVLYEAATASAQVPTGTARLAGEVSDTGGRRLRGAYISIQLVQDVRTPSNHRFAPRSTTADSAGEPASYVLYVRLNIMSRTLDSELVTTRYLDLVRRTVDAPE